MDAWFETPSRDEGEPPLAGVIDLSKTLPETDLLRQQRTEAETKDSVDDLSHAGGENNRRAASNVGASSLDADAIYTYQRVQVQPKLRALVGPTGLRRLSPLEWSVFMCLYDNVGQLVTQEAILRTVWGPGYGDAAALLHDTVSRLRRRFRATGAQEDPIATVYGLGYKLREASP